MTVTRSPGLIRPDEIYTRRELCSRMGMGDHSYREARAAGLPVFKMGRKILILGSDFIEFVKSNAERLPAGE